MNITKIIQLAGNLLDARWSERDGFIEQATGKQVRSINIYFSTLAKANGVKGRAVDSVRHNFTKNLLGGNAPMSTKSFTKGQASVVIHLHRKHPQQIEIYLTNIIKGMCQYEK
jgi:hypothetical protein